MTPDKNFKMNSASKCMIALMKGSKEDKNHFKKMLIQSQLCEEAARRASLKSKDHGDNKNKGVSRGAVAPE
jgi:hypothetical protein